MMKAAMTVLLLLLAAPAAAQQQHRFWDATNIVLFSTNAAAQGLDYWSTERGLAKPGVRETNPLGQSRRGRIVLKSIGTGAPIGISYALHRSGLHRIERWMPVIFAVPNGIAAGLNLRF